MRCACASSALLLIAAAAPDLQTVLREADALAARATGPAGTHADALAAAEALGAAAEALRAAESGGGGGDAALLAAVHVQRAVALDRTGDLRGTEGAAREALEADARSAPAFYSLGRALDGLGDFDGAVDAYREALRLAPSVGRPWGRLAALRKLGEEDVVEMRALLDAGAGDDEKYVRFALAKALEDGGDVAGAFEQYRRGNGALKAEARKPYDRAAATAEVDALIAAFPAGTGHPEPRMHDDAVFIVGLPRSGSTLVEQILCSHSQVVAGGEDTEFAPLVGELMGLLGAGTAPPGGRDPFHWAADEYVRRMRARFGGAPRFTDKSLSNYKNLGFVRMVVPASRVVHTVRDPRDACLSIWRQPLENHDYAHDLEDCAHAYKEHVRLMRHWSESVMPGRVLTVRLEDLVDDQEGETRRLLEFLGLPWEAGVLDFHKTERSVATASLAQVRQPISAAGVGRWRRYAAFLGGPLLDALGEEHDGSAARRQRGGGGEL